MDQGASTSREPRVHVDVTFARLQDAIDSDEYTGFCIGCGAETNGVEPDAERYACDECGSNLVYGAEKLILLELLR